MVTGAGSGIGRAHAIVMASRGASIVVNDTNEAAAEETVALVVAGGGRAVSCIADVSNAAAVFDAVEESRRQLGDVDILVNNAGIPSYRLSFEEIDERTMDRMFAINVKGAMFCVRAVIANMKRHRRGKIINTSSIMGMAAQPRGSHYSAAKAALIGLTKAWAKEFAEWNIQVNAVAPGRVATPMLGYLMANEVYLAEMRKSVPLGRQAEPEEIAFLVAFLVSAEADYITGQIISPNGGEVM